MTVIRLPVKQAGGAIKYVPPYLASNRIYVKDSAGTYQAIVNVPDAVPPAGEFPVRKQDNSQVTIPFWVVQQVEPVPIDAVPVVTITLPVGSPSVDTGDAVTFQASLTLDGNTADAANVVWTSDITGYLFTGAGATLTNLAVNTHTISNQLYTSTDTVTVTVNNVAAPPTVTILSPATGESYPAGSAVKFNATAVDTLDGDLSERIKWYSNTTTGVLYTGQTFVLSGLSPGTHTIRATCRDLDSPPNEGEDSVTLYIASDAPDVTELPLEGQVVIGRQAYGSGVVQ